MCAAPHLPSPQADVAFHLALGVEPVAPNSRDQLFRCAPGLGMLASSAALPHGSPMGWASADGRYPSTRCHPVHPAAPTCSAHAPCPHLQARRARRAGRAVALHLCSTGGLRWPLACCRCRAFLVWVCQLAARRVLQADSSRLSLVSCPSLQCVQGGDPLAQLSLGYRHMQGLGVPKSCQTGAGVRGMVV